MFLGLNKTQKIIWIKLIEQENGKANDAEKATQITKVNKVKHQLKNNEIEKVNIKEENFHIL